MTVVIVVSRRVGQTTLATSERTCWANCNGFVRAISGFLGSGTLKTGDLRRSEVDFKGKILLFTVRQVGTPATPAGEFDMAAVETSEFCELVHIRPP